MTINIKIDLPTEANSEQMAARLASFLSPSLRLTFSGEIGAGKTTFIRAMLRSLGVKSVIKSPSFSIVESYLGTDLQIHHFDLYRISDETELDYIGFRDYICDDSICCIEWPEKAPNYLANKDLEFSLSLKGEGREMNVSAFSSAGAKILSCFIGE